ncbi:MAG TPA: HlyD family efflux transporter periplasmic adaptor subunit [Gemmatimonadaceae bacterium]|nr:HlyD family efflux transporter periplasmic adaptor subunit [Gemmatimonadaceae bacterium]
MRIRWTRIAVGGLGIALVGGALIVLRQQPFDVDVARVVRGPLDQTVVNEGKSRVRERYTVSAPVAGTLARIALSEGDPVRPGSVLARLFPLETPLLDPEARKGAEQRLGSAIDAGNEAKAGVTQARIAAAAAKANLTRMQTLAATGGVSAVQLAQAADTVHLMDAALDAAQFASSVADHQVEEARAALARYTPGAAQAEQVTITSPVQGQVLHVIEKSAGVVTAGEPLLEIGDPHAIELVADVLSQDAVAIRPGMTARVLHWGGNDTLAARVRRIEPSAFTKTSALGVDEQRVNVVLDLDGPPTSASALGDGFAVDVEITVWSMSNVEQIPTSALFREGAAWAVFVVTGGRARIRHVVPGRRGPLQSEIVSGLRPGEVVIIHPGSAVSDGTRVTYR